MLSSSSVIQTNPLSLVANLTAFITVFWSDLGRVATALLIIIICEFLSKPRAIPIFWRWAWVNRLPPTPTSYPRPSSSTAFRNPSSEIVRVIKSPTFISLSDLSLKIFPNKALSRMLLDELYLVASKNSIELDNFSGRPSAKALRALSIITFILSSIRSSRCLATMSLNGRAVSCFLSSDSRFWTPLFAANIEMRWKSASASSSMKLKRSKNSWPGGRSLNKSTVKVVMDNPISRKSLVKPTFSRTSMTYECWLKLSIWKSFPFGVPNRIFSATDALSL